VLLAVHDVAFDGAHVSVVEPPDLIVVGLAESVTVGSGVVLIMTVAVETKPDSVFVHLKV